MIFLLAGKSRGQTRNPVLQRNHRQYQSASYKQLYNNQYQQPTHYQYQQNYNVCDGQDKFFNPLSVYDMGQNILNGLLGPSSGGAGFGRVTVNTQFQNFGNFNGNFNSGVINAHRGGQVGGIGSPTSNSRFQNFGTFNGNANTGVMNGGSQRINYGGVQSGGFGNQATNGGNQAINMIGTQNKFDIEGRDHRTRFFSSEHRPGIFISNRITSQIDSPIELLGMTDSDSWKSLTRNRIL